MADFWPDYWDEGDRGASLCQCYKASRRVLWPAVQKKPLERKEEGKKERKTERKKEKGPGRCLTPIYRLNWAVGHVGSDPAYGHFRVSTSPHTCLFGLWEEARNAGENPRWHRHNMYTPRRKAPAQELQRVRNPPVAFGIKYFRTMWVGCWFTRCSNPQPSGREVAALSTAPPLFLSNNNNTKMVEVASEHQRPRRLQHSQEHSSGWRCILDLATFLLFWYQINK